jgi:integrase
MPTVNFYLKKAEAYPRQSIMKKADAKSAKSLIYLQFKYKGQKFVYSFGEKIHRDNWNPEKQRVKSNNQTTSDGEHSLNDLLKNLAELCEKSYREELKDGIPSKRKLKEHLDNFFYRNLQEDNTERPTLFKLITRFEAGEIKTRGKDKSQGTLNNYKSVRLHLTEFQKKHGYKVDFETINLDFFYQYVSFLKNGLKKKNKKGFTGEVAHLKPNTIAKDIRLLKVFMAEAVDMGFTNNLQFKHKKFTVEGEETDAVYLTEKEVIRLYHCDFSDHNKLEQVRDLFVVGCFTGLRYSDYSNIKPENIITRDDEIFIKMHTKKTGELVIIT